MFSRFFTKTVHALMLDDHTTVCASARISKKECIYQSVQTFQTPDNVYHNGKIAHHQACVAFLKDIRTNMDIKKVLLLLPSHHARSFHIHIGNEHGNAQETAIHDAINTYIKLHLPLSFNEYICEYELVHQGDHGYDFFVSLYPRALARNLLNCAIEAGYDVVSCEIASHMSIEHGSQQIQNDNGFVFLDIGITHSSIAIAQKKRPMISTRLDFGTSHLADIVQDTLLVDEDFADRVIEKYGVLRTHKDKKVLGRLHQQVSLLAQSIRKHITHWQSGATYATSFRRIPVTAIVIGGEGALVKGIDHMISELTGLPVISIDMWHQLKEKPESFYAIAKNDMIRYHAVLGALFEYFVDQKL